MKTRYLKVLVVLGCTAVFMASCGKSEIEPYESKAKLWFTQDYYAGTPVTKHDANDVKRSFALFPGEKTHRQKNRTGTCGKGALMTKRNPGGKSGTVFRNADAAAKFAESIVRDI